MDALVDRIASLATDAERPGPQRRHAAKRMLLDALGCALASYGEDAPSIARTVAQRRPYPAGAHVLGIADPVSPDMAAFANGVMIRYLDLNDTYGSTVGVGHPSDYISAVLAAAEVAQASGSSVLDAIALSYEVFCRLTDVTSLGVERWDHVLNGAVASAVAAAFLLDLGADELRHAIALALAPNVALQVTRLGNVSMWKGCASANAARNGLFAAELALEGVTGPESPFQGRGGLFDALESDGELSAWERTRPAILDCNIKRYPAGYFSQSAIQAALSVRSQIPEATQIVRTEIGTFAYGLQVMAGDPEKWNPRTRETADHSLPYVVAHALAHGDVTADSFSRHALGDDRTRGLLQTLTVSQDAACEEAWPTACTNRVTVYLADGSRISQQIGHYLGHAANPLSDDGLEDKFRGLAEPLLGPDNSAGLARAIWSLDSAPTVGDLFEHVATGIESAAVDRPLPA